MLKGWQGVDGRIRRVLEVLLAARDLLGGGSRARGA